MQIHALHVERYGLLGNVRVELGDTPGGENGVGTTLLDVLRFVGDALNDGVSAALAPGDRFEDVVWYGEGDHFRFAIELTIPKVARYDLARARYEREIGKLDEGGSVFRSHSTWPLVRRPKRKHSKAPRRVGGGRFGDGTDGSGSVWFRTPDQSENDHRTCWK